MPTSSDVVIVGGGAAGCAAAYYLGRAGVKTTLIERAGIGSQASGYSAGGINPLHGVPDAIRPLAREAFTLHLALWDALKGVTGQDCQARLVSMVKVAFDAAEFPALQELHDLFASAEGFSVHWLDSAELRTMEPRLAPGLIRGLYFYGNGALDSYLYTTLLAQAAEHYGATVRTGEVRGLQVSHGHCTGVQLADGVLACETVILAMGPWARATEAWLGLVTPVEPLKGEILRMQLAGPALAHDFLSAEASLYTRAGGQVWCGSTEERCGFDTTPSPAARQSLQQAATKLLPAMADAILVQHTACLRPVTPDGLPILGQAPGWPNVYLATGGGKKGILLSTGIGQALADLITTGSTALSIAPCAPERFALTPSA